MQNQGQQKRIPIPSPLTQKTFKLIEQCPRNDVRAASGTFFSLLIASYISLHTCLWGWIGFSRLEKHMHFKSQRNGGRTASSWAVPSIRLDRPFKGTLSYWRRPCINRWNVGFDVDCCHRCRASFCISGLSKNGSYFWPFIFITIFDKFIVLYTFLVQASNLEMESDYFCYSFLHSFSLLSHPMHDAPMFGLLLAKYANL